MRDRLAPVIEERALLPVARVRSRVLRAAVLNGDDKTVVRLAVEHPVVEGHELTGRLLVEPVRGYERDFDRVVARLRDGLGLEPAECRCSTRPSPPRAAGPRACSQSPCSSWRAARGRTWRPGSC